VPRCACIVFVSTNDDKGQLTITWSSQKRLSQLTWHVFPSTPNVIKPSS